MKKHLQCIFIVAFVLHNSGDRSLFAQNSKPRAAKSSATAITVDPYGKWLATATTGDDLGPSSNSILRFWDIKKQKLYWTQPVDAKSLLAMAFSMRESLLAVDEQGRQHEFFLKTRSMVQRIAPPMPGTRIVLVDPKEHLLLTIDDQIRLWVDGKVSVSASSPDKQGIVAATFLTGGSHLAVATRENTMWLHPRTFRSLQHATVHRQPVTAFAIWHGEWGHVSFTGHNNGSVEYWHAGKKVLRRTFAAHPKTVTQVATYDKANRFVSLGDDGLLKFWEAETGKKLAEERVAPGVIDHFATSTAGHVMAFVSGDQAQVRTLNATLPSQVEQLWTFPITGVPLAEPPLKIANPNQLRCWRIVRGDWKEERGRIIGTGDSRIEFKQQLPSDFTLRLRLQVHGETNPRIRFDAFHFGYEGRKHQLFLHGPEATGKPFPFELERTYLIEVQIDEAGTQATLRIDGMEVAVSHPKSNDERTLSIEAGGKRSQGSCEFSNIEILLPGVESSGDGKNSTEPSRVRPRQRRQRVNPDSRSSEKQSETKSSA